MLGVGRSPRRSPSMAEAGWMSGVSFMLAGVNSWFNLGGSVVEITGYKIRLPRRNLVRRRVSIRLARRSPATAGRRLVGVGGARRCLTHRRRRRYNQVAEPQLIRQPLTEWTRIRPPRISRISRIVAPKAHRH